MAGAICRLYESPQEGELCMKRQENIKVLKLTYLYVLCNK